MKRESTICPPVFFTSAGLLVALLAFTLLWPVGAIDFFTSVRTVVVSQFGWFYVLSVAGFLLFSLWLLFSPYADLKLGKDDEEPAYSRAAWFAMMFAAGMGISLVFYGVGEPMMHYGAPPVGPGGTPEALANALPLTFHHWGFHAWAIYVVVSLPIAYFAYRRDLPLSLRSCFYPVLGERIHGWAGHSIDILAVFGTLFGLATSLALGAMSVNVGFHRLFGMPYSTNAQLVLIGIITVAATLSLVAGMDKGIKRLSQVNLVIAALLLAFVFVCGPTLEVVGGLFEGLGGYLTNFVERSFSFGQADPASEAKWIEQWSIPYWGWWIAWAPFVGVFLARISRGRTIREFVLTVLVVPTGVTFLWFAVFGGTALSLDAAGVPMAEAVTQDTATGVYVMLDQLPLASISSLLAAICVAIFFVSSSDSASYVVDMLTSGGHPDPPIWQRVFWATAEGATAAILLFAGGQAVLKGLQAGVVAFGLPFCALMIVMCFSLVKGLRSDPRFAAAGAGSPEASADSGEPAPPSPDDGKGPGPSTS